MFKFEKDRLNIWDARFMQGEKMRCFTKLLYMYFLTSSLSNKLGVYQISNARIKCDLNLDDGELITAMHELKECKKVRRCGSYIIIKDATYYIKKDKKTLEEKVYNLSDFNITDANIIVTKTSE